MSRASPRRPDGCAGRLAGARIPRPGLPGRLAARVGALLAVVAAAGSAWGCVTEAGPSLTVVSWGGSYARAFVLG